MAFKYPITRIRNYAMLLAPVVLAFVMVGCGRNQVAGNPQAASPESSASAPFSKPESDAAPSPASGGLLNRFTSSPVTVPAGTPVAVRLQANVSSATAISGQEFDAVLEEPLVVNGKTIAPQGTPLVGRVVSARHSGRLHNPGYLRLTLASMVLGGKQVPLQTSSVVALGGSHKNRNLAWIGGSTAGGAIIGALAGGGKGAAIGSLVGAAGGTGAAFATGKKEVGFGAERRLTFRLLRPLELRA